jgi:2-keto-4-pentenoate hydratase/2-oxohepta-3-ene-1,7-dioic acid hydratase in catechol pathway
MTETQNNKPGHKHARVVYEGQTLDAVEHDGTLKLSDQRVVTFDQVQWLPPLQPVERPRTVIALGLNYADHAKELAFKEPPKEPLAFIKGEASLIGHNQHTIRPQGVQFMHYECELAVVIGRTARRVKRADAFDYVQGYTVVNDFAIRDYLENWYRPNLRVHWPLVGRCRTCSCPIRWPHEFAFANHRERQGHAKRQHTRHDFRCAHFDRILQHLHDPEPRRFDFDRHTRWCG